MVEIIPKKTPQIPSSLNFLFYFSLILFIASLIVFFVLNSSIKNSRKTLEDLEKRLAEFNAQDQFTARQEILNYQKRIRDFSQLINQHLITSKVFGFIERETHPKVWFSQFSFNPKENKVTLSGSADSFESLGQQILILKGLASFQNVELSGISMSKEGKADFGLSFLIDSKLLR